ncbi:MAG: type II toxin-antitoxin system RelE/ParE family toxin [bacterium]
MSRHKATKPRVRWMPQSLKDLDEIRRYIARHDPVGADRWLRRLVERGRAAAAFPLSGRPVPEVAADHIREVLLKSYRIIYRVMPDGIHIMTVFEGHRRFPLEAITDPEP